MAFDDYSMPNAQTLAKCKKHNRYQRCDYWESKAINKLLLAIQQGYVPVGRSIPKVQLGKKPIRSGE